MAPSTSWHVCTCGRVMIQAEFGFSAHPGILDFVSQSMQMLWKQALAQMTAIFWATYVYRKAHPFSKPSQSLSCDTCECLPLSLCRAMEAKLVFGGSRLFGLVARSLLKVQRGARSAPGTTFLQCSTDRDAAFVRGHGRWRKNTCETQAHALKSRRQNRPAKVTLPPP